MNVPRRMDQITISRDMNTHDSIALPQVVMENANRKTIQVLGDRRLMPRAARKRLGSSLSGDQLKAYIQAVHREGQENWAHEQQRKLTDS